MAFKSTISIHLAFCSNKKTSKNTRVTNPRDIAKRSVPFSTSLPIGDPHLLGDQRWSRTMPFKENAHETSPSSHDFPCPGQRNTPFSIFRRCGVAGSSSWSSGSSGAIRPDTDGWQGYDDPNMISVMELGEFLWVLKIFGHLTEISRSNQHWWSLFVLWGRYTTVVLESWQHFGMIYHRDLWLTQGFMLKIPMICDWLNAQNIGQNMSKYPHDIWSHWWKAHVKTAASSCELTVSSSTVDGSASLQHLPHPVMECLG